MDFLDRNSVAVAGRVAGSGSVISASTLWRWAIEGKIFEAGLGAEDAAIALDATFADTTPLFSLQAPSATTPKVIPIMAKISIHNDGSSATRIELAFTKPAGLCATALTLTGTALTSKHSLYRSSPAQTAQQCTTLSNVTASALVAADYATYDYLQPIDALLTTGKVNLGGGPSNVHTWRFLKDGYPHILTSGAAMLIFASNSTTDATAKCYMQWAEVTVNDLS